MGKCVFICVANQFSLFNLLSKCSMHFYSFVMNIFGSILQLKYHDTGREKDCLPQVGQWNMMNKVSFVMKLFYFFLKTCCILVFYDLSTYFSLSLFVYMNAWLLTHYPYMVHNYSTCTLRICGS